MRTWYYALVPFVEIVVPRSGGGTGFVSNGLDGADLWERRRKQIEDLARSRMQPRMVGAPK